MVLDRYLASTAVTGNLSVSESVFDVATEIVGFDWAMTSTVEGEAVTVSGKLQTTGGVALPSRGVDLYFFEAGFDPGAGAATTPDAVVSTDALGMFSATFQTAVGDAGKSFRCRAIFRETIA